MALPDSTDRFSNRVADYVRFRPRYPDSVVDLLVDRIGLARHWTVADIGSGTGLSAELFLRYGCRVVAVEPNEAMRLAAEEALGAVPAFVSKSGRAEDTGLADASVDLIVAAQAFHWFDVSAARAEFARILKAPRRVALIRNRRRLSGTPFLEAYEQFLLQHGTDYRRVRHENVSDHLLTTFFEGDFDSHVLENQQVLDRDGLFGRVRSSSYVPAPDHPAYPAMMADLEALFSRFASGGTVELAYDLEIYLGRV